MCSGFFLFSSCAWARPNFGAWLFGGCGLARVRPFSLEILYLHVGEFSRLEAGVEMTTPLKAAQRQKSVDSPETVIYRKQKNEVRGNY